MEIAICALLAYLLSGISLVIKDLGGKVIDRPMWAMNPTLGKTIMVALTWPSRPILASYSSGQLARAIAFGVLGILIQMTVLTACIWASYAVAGLVLESLIFKLALAAIIAFIGSLFVLPLVTLIMIPVTLLLAWPLDLLFPQASSSPAKDIRWCRTCRHHRKVPEYENTMTGLWRKESMPRSDKLPCKIVLETSQAWEAYYETEPKSRALFPGDCPFFERQA